MGASPFKRGAAPKRVWERVVRGRCIRVTVELTGSYDGVASGDVREMSCIFPYNKTASINFPDLVSDDIFMEQGLHHC